MKPKQEIEKALEINLDESIYGTVAEIGAGQEVARNFFIAGGAAGTIAKTMSAYDMKVSDTIYGTEEDKRYVSRSRVQKMVDREYDLVVERLKESRHTGTRFFAFANTVAAKAYNSKKDCHGWLGIRFQHKPDAETSCILIHIRLKDKTNRQQQVAVGKLGVNLIYGAFYYFRSPEFLIGSLIENVGFDSIEINNILFSGSAFEEVNNRLMALHLVKTGLTRSVMFSSDGSTVQPSELLYKKNILLFRGTFRPVTKVHVDIIKSGYEQLLNEPSVSEENSVIVAEISMSKILNLDDHDNRDYLARVDLLCKLGYNVQVSDYFRYFQLKQYLRQFTNKNISIVIGARKMEEIYFKDFYADRTGGLLEAMGILFAGNTKIYVYPKLTKGGDLIEIDNLQISDEFKYLHKHFIDNKQIIPLTNYNQEITLSNSLKIQNDLKDGNENWINKVPETVYQDIKDKGLFGYK